MRVASGPGDGGERETLAQRAVHRRVAAVTEVAQSEVDALMEAGLALMVQNGGRRGPRVADIVAAAGLSNESFYRYFASKDALVEAIVEQGAHAVISYVRHRIAAAAEPGTIDPAAQLRAGIAAIMKQVSDPALADQTRAVLGNSPAMSPGSRHISVALVEALTELFTPPAAELGAGDSVRAARTVASAAVATMQYYLFRGEVPDENDLAQLTAFLTAGVTALRPTAPAPG
jgi:AcrR family transcriptional regulator